MASDSTHVDGDGDEGGPDLDAAPREGGVRSQDAGGLARRADAAHRVLDRRDHVGVSGLADVAEARRQVRRADEDAVDAVDRGDLLEPVERLARLDLHEQAEFLGGPLGVARNPPEPRGSRQARHAAHTLGRVARRCDGGPRLVRVLHVGDQQGLRAEIEEALDQDRVVAGGTHHRRHVVGRHRLKLRKHGEWVARRVLCVEQQPVVARARRRLGGVGTG